MNNSLAEVHPELITEWSEKNLPLTPDDITFGSNKKVWWKGACGHEWQAIHAVMSEEKPNQKEKIVLRGDRVRQLIPKNIPVSQTEDFVCKALEHYNKFLRNRAERDSR